MRKILEFCGLILLSAYAFVVRADEPVKIGVLTDLTGQAAYFGNQTRIGAMLAANELNAEDKKVRLIFEDSGLNTQQGLSAAHKLIQIDNVDALYVDFTPIVVSVSSFVQANQKLLVYSAAAESVAKSNPYAFKTYSNYSKGCEELAREFKKRGVQRMGVLKAEAEYGDLCLTGVKKIYANPIEQSYKRGESVATQVFIMKNKGAEAVINGSYEGDVMNMLKALSDINYKVTIGAPEDSLTRQVSSKFSNYLQGSITFGLKHLSDPLIARARQISGGSDLTSFEGVGLGYLHIKQMYAALSECRKAAVDCAVEALAKSPAAPDVGFEGWQNRIAVLYTALKEFKEGKLQLIESSAP
jgi:ABC-type branched-subunit amino acid transport system substrate-binding protein